MKHKVHETVPLQHKVHCYVLFSFNKCWSSHTKVIAPLSDESDPLLKILCFFQVLEQQWPYMGSQPHSSVRSLSHVWFFVTPWTEACQASLSITNSWSLLRLMFIESVMPSRYLIFCHPLLFCPQSLPASESFPMSQLFAWGSQSIGVSALASFLPRNTQGWSPSEWTGWISLQSKGLSRVFSNTTVQKHKFFSSQLSSQFNSYIHTWPQEKP